MYALYLAKFTINGSASSDIVYSIEEYIMDTSRIEVFDMT